MIDNKKKDNFKRLFLKSFEKTKNSFSDTFQIYSHENLKFIDKKIYICIHEKNTLLVITGQLRKLF
jgi:hypothetical protein